MKPSDLVKEYLKELQAKKAKPLLDVSQRMKQIENIVSIFNPPEVEKIKLRKIWRDLKQTLDNCTNNVVQ